MTGNHDTSMCIPLLSSILGGIASPLRSLASGRGEMEPAPAGTREGVGQGAPPCCRVATVPGFLELLRVFVCIWTGCRRCTTATP